MNTNRKYANLRAHGQAGVLGRKGFTLLELLVVSCISAILAVAVSSLYATTWRVYLTEYQQNDVNLRARSLMTQFAADAQAASYVVSAGTTAYTVPSTSSTIPPSTFSGTITQNVVFQVPSTSSTGIIASTYDYIGLTWDSVSKKVTRTVVIGSGSTRAAGSAVVSLGGLYVQAPITTAQPLFFQFHIASSAPTNAKSTYPAAGQTFPSLNSSRLADIDEVLLNAIIQETVYNTTVSQTLTTSAKLRNWRQT